MFHRTVFLGHDLIVFLPGPNWEESVEVTHRITSTVETGLTYRENRFPRHSFIRHEQAAAWRIYGSIAQELEVSLIELGAPSVGDRVYVGLPMFADKLSRAAWGSRIYHAEWVLNYDETGCSIIAANAVPEVPARRWLAPLLVGRLAQRPDLDAITDNAVEYTLQLVERSPWDFRIAPVEAAVGPDWPSSLKPNWLNSPRSGTEDLTIVDDVGDGRVEALDNQEGIVRRTQRFSISLKSRDEIRLLLNFFLARKGRVESFAAPWFHRPGSAGPETPHVTQARFTQDELTLRFVTDGYAEAEIEFTQVPWEEDGVAGEEPVQKPDVYFYRFWQDVPGGPIVWRFTNWEHDLTRTENEAPVAYLGDTKAFFKHDQVDQTIDFSDNPTTLSSWMFDGNPLMLAVKRELEAPLNIEIRHGTPDAPNDAKLIYVGKIGRVKDVGRQLRAETIVLGGKQDAKIPAKPYGPNCKHDFCRAGCNLNPANWTFEGFFSSQTGMSVTVAVGSNPPGAGLEDDWFAGGWIKHGAGANYEIRQIVRSENLGGGNQRFRLRRPFRHFAVSETVTFRPHCRGTPTECHEKYNNRLRFGAHPRIGPKNLSLPTRDIETPTGKK
ncbi:phage BR0599 family protein [Oleiharenicola lentus]|uniref:phage BR0599 family protein n=1 Tax=Oleiharenicola lentus TaxID=2508720 RepID=UPI003F6646C0